MFILINSNATGLLTLFYIYIIYIVEYLLDHTAGWAIYSFLSNPNNFWESIFTCLKPGGDTDTVAACCGSIAGAYNGLQKIIDERHDSMHVLKHIHDETQEGKIGLEELKEVGNKLYVVCVGASSKL